MFGSLFLIIEGSHIQKYHRPLPYTYNFHHAFITLHLARVLSKSQFTRWAGHNSHVSFAVLVVVSIGTFGSISVEAKTSGSRKKIPRKSNHRN